MSDARARLPIADTDAVRRELVARLRRHRVALVAACLAVTAWTIVGLLVPPLLGVLVDQVVGGAAMSALIPPATAILALVVVGGVLGFGADVLIARQGAAALADLREDVLARAIALPAERLEEAGTGDLVTRVGDDVAMVADAIERVLPTLAFTGLTVVFTIVGLAWLDPWFAVAALMAVPIQVVGLRWYLRRCVPLYAAARVAEAEQAQQLLATVSGARTIRALGLRRRERQRVDARSARANGFAYEAVVVQTRLSGALNVAEFVAMSLVLAIGFVLARDGQVTIGAVTAAALYVHRSFDPVGALLNLFDDLLVAGAGLARLVGVLDLPAGPRAMASAGPGRGAISVRGLRHSYGTGVEVLRGIDLDVAPGEHVALVGPSGAGKSTLARVLAGAVSVREGSVTVDGVKSSRGTAARPAGVCLITQEVHVFAGTLADDLRLAAPDASDAQLQAALDRMAADRLRPSLPDGLATIVGAGGRVLTPADAQSIALARGLLADRPIVILDEATAEADSADAGRLDVAAAALADGRTTIVIAHRLSQAADADRIVVLEEGLIVEVGAHDALLEADGPYRLAWSAWSSARPALDVDSDASTLATE